jgi:hypothetical protein
MHELTIEYDRSARYPHKAVCTCGYRSWGYLTRQAAEIAGGGHVDEATIAAFEHPHAS